MIAWLVETLVATTALMLLVLAMREPVRRLFGSHVAYALWLLPALRMILPPFASLLPQSVQETAVVQSSGAVTELVRVQIAELAPAALAAVSPEPEIAASGAASWPLIMAGLWLVGLMLFALNQWLAYRRFCGFILSDATPRDELAPGIMLVTSPRAKGPMAFGLRRRFIVLPEDAEHRFDNEERAMALAHELAHHTRGDLFANAAALALLTLHWCNPVAWFAYRAFRTDQEMACDADVIDAVRGSALGHAYGRALVKSASGLEFAAVCNLTTVDRLKRRLAMLSNKSPSNRRRKTGFLIAGSVVVSGLILTASGESMAAQVGARVSEALPIPRMQDALSSLPAVSVVPVLYGTAPEAPETPAAPAAPRTDRLAAATGVAPVAPVAPTPPTPGVAPTPPTPPTPPAAPAPPAPGMEKVERIVTVSVDDEGKRTRHVTVRRGDGPTEVVTLKDLPDIRSAHCGTGPDKPKEALVETKDGERKVVIICQDRIEKFAMDAQRMALMEQGMAEKYKDLAMRSALVGLQSAKTSIETNSSLSAEEKARALAGINEAIDELRSHKDDD